MQKKSLPKSKKSSLSRPGKSSKTSASPKTSQVAEKHINNLLDELKTVRQTSLKNKAADSISSSEKLQPEILVMQNQSTSTDIDTPVQVSASPTTPSNLSDLNSNDVEWITPKINSIAPPTPAPVVSLIKRVGSIVITLILGGLIYAYYLQMTSATLQSHLSISAKVNINLKHEVEKLRGENTKLQLTIADYETKIKEFEASVAQSNAQLTELKEQAVALREERQALKVRVPRLEQTNENQKKEIINLSARAVVLDKEIVPIHELKKKLQIAQDEGQKYKKDALRATSELANLQNRIKESQDQRRTDILAEKNRAIASAQDSKKDYQKNLAQLQGEVEKLEADLASASKNIKAANERNQTMQSQTKKDLAIALQELNRSNTTKKRLITETADMHYNLGVIFLQSKNYPKAIQEFEKDLSMRYDDADAHYNLALIYDEQLKDNARALEHYRSYLKIRPAAEDATKIQKWIIDKESIVKVEK